MPLLSRIRGGFRRSCKPFKIFQDQRVIWEIVMKCSKNSIHQILLKILYSHLTIRILLAHKRASMRFWNPMEMRLTDWENITRWEMYHKKTSEIFIKCFFELFLKTGWSPRWGTKCTPNDSFAICSKSWESPRPSVCDIVKI